MGTLAISQMVSRSLHENRHKQCTCSLSTAICPSLCATEMNWKNGNFFLVSEIHGQNMSNVFLVGTTSRITTTNPLGKGPSCHLGKELRTSKGNKVNAFPLAVGFLHRWKHEPIQHCHVGIINMIMDDICHSMCIYIYMIIYVTVYIADIVHQI